jgi:hypothetical protein
MVKEVVEEAAMVLDAEEEVVAEIAIEDKKRVNMRSTKTHTVEIEAEEEEDQISIIFNIM